MMKPIELRIYELIACVLPGKVVTYGNVAHIVGTSARAVGKILHNNPNPDKYPCHRVVFANGQLSKSYAFGGWLAQREKLEREGVVFKDNRVDMKACRFDLNSRSGLGLRAFSTKS